MARRRNGPPYAQAPPHGLGRTPGAHVVTPRSAWSIGLASGFPWRQSVLIG